MNDRYGSRASFWKFVVDGGQTTVRNRIAEVLAAQYSDELDRMRDVLRYVDTLSSVLLAGLESPPTDIR